MTKDREQESILHLVSVLLVSVDIEHRKKFHKGYLANTRDEIFMPSCSSRGWLNGNYEVDFDYLTQLWGKITKKFTGVS
jgi:hypothetical protein